MSYSSDNAVMELNRATGHFETIEGYTEYDMLNDALYIIQQPDLHTCQDCGCTTDLRETHGEVNHWRTCGTLPIEGELDQDR